MTDTTTHTHTHTQRKRAGVNWKMRKSKSIEMVFLVPEMKEQEKDQTLFFLNSAQKIQKKKANDILKKKFLGAQVAAVPGSNCSKLPVSSATRRKELVGDLLIQKGRFDHHKILTGNK